MREFIVEADGGSRGNPGPAGYGAVVVDAETGQTLAERAEYLGVVTNNVAEYRGLVAGLRAAHELDPSATIHVRMDSKLVVEQMSGRWKIKHPGMKPLAAEAARVFPPGRVTYEWIPRERNKHADRLANEAMDAGSRGEQWSPSASTAERDRPRDAVAEPSGPPGDATAGAARARAALARGRSALAQGRSALAQGRSALAEGRSASAEGRPASAEGRPAPSPASSGSEARVAKAGAVEAGAEAGAVEAGAEARAVEAGAEAGAEAPVVKADAEARAVKPDAEAPVAETGSGAPVAKAEAGAPAPRAGAEASAVKAGADERAAQAVATPAVGWGAPPDMGAPATFVLLRHGETPLTPQKRFSGSGGTDPSLSDAGREQAAKVAAALARRGTIQAVVSSPLARTRETAAIVAARLGLEVTVDEGLRETDFGAWEGLTFGEVHERYPDDLNAWLTSPEAEPTGGGESFAATAARVAATRDKLVAAYAGRTVLLVSHVTPIKTFIRLALGAPPESLFRMELSAASLSAIAYYADGNASLRLFNDTSHLR